VRIVVEDNGKGLPKEGRERLTEPYMTTRSKGTGLGLAIVKKIMEDHGGTLRSRTARVAAPASVWYSVATRRKSRRRLAATPHNDPLTLDAAV
jgi:two-component system nitrogen regulation sensor histidine kinase NtrY